MLKTLKLTVTLAGLLILAACSTSHVAKEDVAGLPEWLVHPEVAGGIAATECVPWSGDMSVDQKQAVAQARASIASQITLRVRAMDKTYQSKSGSAGSNSGVFESVSRQTTERTLNGTQVAKMGVIPIGKAKHLCVQVNYGATETKELFERLVGESQVTLSKTDKDVLWDEFKAARAHEDLKAEFNKNAAAPAADSKSN
jgi:hypothetical protein